MMHYLFRVYLGDPVPEAETVLAWTVEGAWRVIRERFPDADHIEFVRLIGT